jgi:uncharacterized repeat protein (TIGR01451 family)
MNADANRYALPSWWRFMLVALTTLILCSCQTSPEANGAPPADTPPTSVARNVIKEGPKPIPRPRSDVRTLSGDAIAASRPLTSKEIAAGWAVAAPCNCACCGGGSAGNGCAPNGACDAPCYVCPEQAWAGPPDEYLCDGGDSGLPAAVRADWTVDGLEQEDAIAHYDTLDGRVVVTPSNRVCIYAPRFAAVRRVENILSHERRQLIDINVEATTPVASAEAQPVVASTQRTGVAINLGQQPASLFRGREQAAEVVQVVAPGEFFGTVGPYALVEVLRTGQVVGSEIPAVKRIVQNAVAWNGDQGPQVVYSNRQAVAVVGLKQPGIVFQTDEPGDPRLRLIKCASTSNAQPGEDVEFTLRFDNIGDQTIGNVTIIDNLTTRLEYVPDTAKSTLAANFTSVPNGTGSTVMRWEIVEPLKPGEGGVLTFKCRVR